LANFSVDMMGMREMREGERERGREGER